jgi:hypothetical protein
MFIDLSLFGFMGFTVSFHTYKSCLESSRAGETGAKLEGAKSAESTSCQDSLQWKRILETAEILPFTHYELMTVRADLGTKVAPKSLRTKIQVDDFRSSSHSYRTRYLQDLSTPRSFFLPILPEKLH